MDFISIDPEEKKTAIANAIVSREQEIMSYQLNIDNYTAMLNAMSHLSKDWPAEIASYANMNPTQIATVVPDDLLELVNDYMYRDRIAFLLKTEKIEQSKSKRVLEALKLQMPEAEIVERVTAAKAQVVAQRLRVQNS